MSVDSWTSPLTSGIWLACEATLGRELTTVDSRALLIEDLGFSDYEFYVLESSLYAAACFTIPDQFAHADIRLMDLEYYLSLHLAHSPISGSQP